MSRQQKRDPYKSSKEQSMKIYLNKILLIVLLIGASFAADSKPVIAVQNDSIIQFVFCSDLHFGLTKPVFRNKVNVSAAEVNDAMLTKMNEVLIGM